LHFEKSFRDALYFRSTGRRLCFISPCDLGGSALFAIWFEADFPEDKALDFQMSNIEKFPRDVIETHDAAMASANTMAATIQTIATAHVEYARKTIEDGTDFITKLTSLQSPDQAIGLQTEFAENSYQAFVLEMRKISELYVDLLEHSCKPFETFAIHQSLVSSD
jgi:phasin family protein